MLFTVWIILIILLAVICTILFSKIKIRIFFSEDGIITVKYLFFKYEYFFKDKSGGKISKKKSKKKSKKDKATEKDNNYIKKLFKENGILDGACELISIIKLIFEKIILLLSKLEVAKLDLFAEFSEGDAAGTAITYGGVCAFLYPVIGWINATCKVKKQNIDVHTLYTDQKVINFRFEAVLKVKAISLVFVAASFLWSLLKDKFKIQTKQKG